jgi:hypothetical protein
MPASFRSSLCQLRVSAILLTLSTLVITQSQPLKAAPPGDLSGSLPGAFSGATLMTADRADLALDTGLWRGEFLNSQDEETSAVAGTLDDKNQQGLQAMRASDVSKRIDVVNLEDAAEEYFEDGEVLLTESTGDEILAATEIPENLSDWEQAICNVTDDKNLSGGQKGPSMITVIVAVVGMIVVIGAYMKK